MTHITQLLWLILLTTIALSLGSESDRQAFAQGNQKQAKVKEVPLALIYYTFPQKGVKVLCQGEGDKNCANEMKALVKSARQTGASNVFLARGDEVSEAVKAAWKVFCWSEPVNKAFPPAKISKSDQFWLVAYLGTAGSHGEWFLKSARIKENTIRLTYSKGREGTVLAGKLPYFAWVPLGKLEPGTYTLELFDERENHVMFLRQVMIPNR